MGNQIFKTALTDLPAAVKGSPIATQFARVAGVVTSFGRSNPLITTAVTGITATGLVAVARARVKRRKKAKVTRRKKVKRKKARKKTRRKTHARPRHRGHKVVSFVNKKTGKRVRFLVRGPKRSPKHQRKRKQRRFVKGSPEAKRFMAKLRRMKK